MALHANDYFAYKLGDGEASLFDLQASASDIIFYRLNVPSVYNFAQ